MGNVVHSSEITINVIGGFQGFKASTVSVLPMSLRLGPLNLLLVSA